MLAKLEDAVASVRGLVSSLEPDRMRAVDAAKLVDSFAELERLAVAGRTLAGRRVERSTVWRDEGFSTPARWMAARAQTTVAAAITAIETGRRLEELPATRDAFQSGALSGMQAAEIAAAAVADPSAEESLLEEARGGSVAGLRDRCRQVAAAAASGDARADERIHRGRYVRSWLDADGAFRLDGRLTPDAGARFIASVRARGRAFQEQARRAGSNERSEAHMADALVSLAEAGTPSPRAVVHVHVDRTAWERGRVEPGERCVISGVGPVPVAAARRLAQDGIVKAVLAEDADIRAVAHFRRSIPARLRTALEARDLACVVPGCDEREGLEIDHIRPLFDDGPTRLSNLARLCRWHHSLKTHRGWQLAGGPGDWKWFKRERERDAVRPARE